MDSKNARIGDLVELPLVRTVIQLADLEDAELASRILDDFVLTADSDVALTTLLESISSGIGQGFFLQGNFGSGKSHLLAVLDLLLRSKQSWQSVIRQDTRYESLCRRVIPAPDSNINVSVSLVEHSGSSSLEDICLPVLESALAKPLGISSSFAAHPHAVEEIRAAVESRHQDELRAFCEDNRIDRSRVFDPSRPDLLDVLVRKLDLPFRVRRERSGFFGSLASALGDDGPKRAVLILDELSEFLRSKPDRRAFNEDIRFLQFLGEASGRMPFWIVASLQEHIETTGEIDQAIFSKIKDRYPVRLSLTGKHLRELASSRLIKKRPGAEAAIAAVHREIKNAFTSFNVRESELTALYPVHPATLELLDDLLPLFSRHRGAVDFLHYQLAGDPRRQISGMLDLPAHKLLGPESILDHFRVRIRETLETAPYMTVVLAFYEKELPKLFPDEEERTTALRLLKLLILGAVSPIRRRRTVADLAEMLLFRVTDLDPSANYDFIRDRLETMLNQGAYLAVERGKHRHEDVYYVDLTADVHLIIGRRVDGLLEDPGFTLGRALEMLLPSFASTLMPLASISSAPRSNRRVSWQKTRREGILLFSRGEDDPIVSDASLDEIGEKLDATDLDFCLIMMAPNDETSEPAGLLARLRDRGSEPYLLWWPSALREETIEQLRRAAARLAVQDHFVSEGSEVGKRVVAALEPLIQEDRELTESQVQRAYREGRFLHPLDSPKRTPAELPSLPFDRILERVAEIALDRRFPRHYLVAPTLELPTTEAGREMVLRFLRAGEIELRETPETLRVAIEAHLRPLGLVKRVGTAYRLQADPKSSDLVRFVLDRIGAGRVAFDTLYQELRKGLFGLDRAHIELTIEALVFSGQVTAYSKGRKVSADSLDTRSFARVDQVGPGEMVSPELQSVLAGLPFVPPRFRKGTFGFAQQRELWEHIVNWKATTGERLANVSVELDRARSYRSAAHLDLAGLADRLAKLQKVLDEVKTSYQAREGLERLANTCREEPDLVGVYEDFETLARFFTDEWQRYLFIQKYLSDRALDFPARFDELAARREELRRIASRADIPLAIEAAGRLREEFQDFLLAYGKTYEKEHQQLKSPQRLTPLKQIREGRSYRLLRRLSEIHLVSVDDDRVKIDRLMDGASAKICSRLSPEDLRSKPTCECGFRLGDEVELPSATEVQEAIERGIRQYISSIGQAPYREKIESSLFGLTEVGKDSLAAKTKQFLELDSHDADGLEQAEKLVDRELVDSVNGALSGKVVLVDRRLEDLTERLIERSFPKAKLLELMERWIDGDAQLGQDDYVRIVSRSTGATGLETLFKELVVNRYPELSSRWEQAGESAFIRDAVTAFRNKASKEPESPVSALLGEAFEAFAQENPKETAELLGRVERSLGPEERQAALSDVHTADDPVTLLAAVFEERAFRFVVQAAGTKLLRMLGSDTQADRLAEASRKPPMASELPAPLVERLAVEELIAALTYGVRIRTTTRTLQDLAMETLDTAPSWEKLYKEHLALAHLAASELERTLEKLQLDQTVDLHPLRTEQTKQCHRASEAFERYYLDQLPGASEQESEKLHRLDDVFARLRRKYEDKLHPAAIRFVLLDGMRWDIWHRLKTTLLPDLTATYRVVDELALWSAYPTSTKVQLERAGLGLPEQTSLAAEPEVSYNTTRGDNVHEALPGFHRLIGPNGESVERLDLIDEKVHESKAELVDLVQEIELHSRRTLTVLLEEAQRGTMLLLFSDHGFVEDPRWKPDSRYRRARYKHGGASPWEVLTPFVVLYRT
jgi:hypothetical protein